MLGGLVVVEVGATDVVPPPPAVVVVVVVVVGTVVVVVVVGTVVVVVVVGTVVVVVVVGTVVVVVVVPASQCEIVSTGVGGSPCESSQVQVATAVVLAALVPGPFTSRLKLFPDGVIAPESPFTVSVTLLTNWASLPNPARIHRDVPPEQGRNPAPLTPFQVVCCVLANAAPGKMAQAIISRVPVVTPINPAVVSRLLRLTRSCWRSIFRTSLICRYRLEQRGTLFPVGG
jgi:hypothetical protein